MIEEAIKKLEADELAALAKQIAERVLILKAGVAKNLASVDKEQALIKRGLELDINNKDAVKEYLKDISYLDYSTGTQIYLRTS